MKVIDERIIRFSVAAGAGGTAGGSTVTTAGGGGGQQPSNVINIERMHEKIERPEILSGQTYKVVSPLMDQSLYVTINDAILNLGTPHEQRLPFEVFVNSKNMEAFQWIVGLTRMISAVFRKGGDVTFVVKQLKSVFDPRGGYLKQGSFIPSVVAELGIVIERHLCGLGLIRKSEMSEEMRAYLAAKREAAGSAMRGALQCPECDAVAVVLQSGCKTCLECGHSKCG